MRLLILAAALLTATSAIGQSTLIIVNGNELHAECQDRSPICVGYVAGVADALEALSGSVPHTCRQEQVELGQLVDLARQTLIDNPATRHRGAFNIVAEAFVAEWPC
ncbi:Rap1a/Tai family immunity protein [Pelagibacterium mangrovi]|uniref:Rap1a/Tai family immunity protein n=1 Tax=Pelagibacterium mangrovi TaxID=3119828 RepID=UPI003F80BC27